MNPNLQLRLRHLLVIGELLIIAALAFMASQRQLTLVLFLPLGIGMVMAFLRWPPLGLIVAPLAGMIVPFVGPSGLNVTMILVALLLGLWLLDMMVHHYEVQFSPSRTVWPLLSFVVIAFISFGVGQLNWLPLALHAPLGAQLGGLAIIVLSAGTFLLMTNLVRDLRWLRIITWAFLAFSVLAIILRSLLPGLGFSTQNLIQPIGAVYYIWVVSLAFSQALLNGDLHPGWRWALGGLVLITLYNQLFLKFANKSGWIPVIVCIAAIIGFRSWRAGLVLFPIAVVAVLILKAGVVSSEDYSVSTRLDAWLILAHIIKISPILGLGFANYYWYTPLFPIRGYAVSFNSHNNYVDIVAQTGLVGLVCFLWFLWELGRLSWRLRERAPAGFAQAYVYGALGGLAGTAVIGMMGDWVLPFFYNIGLIGFRTSMLGWLFLGGLVSIEQMVMSQKYSAA
ncbi:MAG TPA: O-antigen ligase family protein [Anaerolineales bacterium]|nr:O-antigen ligase family protein [Anaerolineales bacterium]